VVNVGSSVSITAANTGSASLYVSNNSNPSIANVNISGSQVTISGNVAGSTTVTLCPVGNTTNCPSVYVTVEPSGAGQLSFSQNNASVVSGQNLPITVSGGNGVYNITNNSNPSVIQASVSGSVLTLSTGSSSGSSSLTICSSDMAMCGVVAATAGSASSVAITFSNGSPTVSINQGTVINIYGPTGVQFYVSSNSNPSIMQANLSGTTLTLTGIAAGSSTVSVCASTGTCSSLTATVQNALTGANISLSQNTASILSGQNINITVSGGQQPYFISGGTASVSQETLSGSTLTVYGIATGVSSVNVCSAGGGCVMLIVTVNGASAPSSVPTVTTPAVTVPVTTTPTVTSAPSYIFTKYLAPGSSGTDVTALQNLLVAQGMLSATPNGYYGAQTRAAVIKLQAAHNINPLGVVGPSTRAMLNQLESAGVLNGGSSNASITSMNLSQLQAEVQSLESELTQALNRISQLTGQ